jgi:ATP-dependent DNA helicase DinG
VIVKLPFLSPDSPYEEAKSEWLSAKGVDVFNDYNLPKAIVKFRQGFGRLIRGKTDRGIVAILDPRVKTKRYGPRFLNALPVCRPLRDLSAIEDFFLNAEKLTP